MDASEEEKDMYMLETKMVRSRYSLGSGEIETHPPQEGPSKIAGTR